MYACVVRWCVCVFVFLIALRVGMFVCSCVYVCVRAMWRCHYDWLGDWRFVFVCGCLWLCECGHFADWLLVA